MQSFPAFATVAELIDFMAETRSERVFLISPEDSRSLSFAQLRDSAQTVTTQLRQLGLMKGAKVASLSDNGVPQASLLLGAMYGGFVPVPLNPLAGKTQLHYMLENSDAEVVFASDDYAELLVDEPLEVIAPLDGLNLHAFRPRSMSTCASRSPLCPEDDALLLYTSGTTDQPKGVLLSHGNLLAGAGNSVRAYRLQPSDRHLCVLPLYHISAPVPVVLSSLLSGSSVVLPKRLSLPLFWSWVDNWQCTWLPLIPTIVGHLLESDVARGTKHPCFARSSSAALPAAQQRAFEERFGIPLFQTMGSTEAGGMISSTAFQPRKPGSCGVAPGFEVRITDTNGAPLPAGKTGDLWVRGPSVMRGYYKDPDATRACLDADGWLYTGDFAYLDDDGHVFIVGRSREMIIHSGEKIAPTEIDDVLTRHPAVAEAAVVGVPSRHVGNEIVACVVCKCGQQPTTLDLLNWCRQELGDFKTPSQVLFVDGLPRGGTGKIQRIHLAEWAKERIGSASLHDDVRTSVSQADITAIVIAVWRDVLKVAEIKSDDNFFQLGGDSLRATQIANRLSAALQLALPVQLAFDNPTVASMSAAIGRARQVGPSYPPLRPQPGNSFPMSFSQEFIWRRARVDNQLGIFHDITGPLNIEALHQVLDEIAARHHVLRSTFNDRENDLSQTISDRPAARLAVIDLTGNGSVLTRANQFCQDELARPINLEQNWPWRIHLLRLGQHRFRLCIILHHMVHDAGSAQILHRELGDLYAAFNQRISSPLPPPALQFADYAVWHRQLLDQQGLVYQKQLSYWLTQLRDPPPLLKLPSQRRRPVSNAKVADARRPFAVSRTVTERLLALARETHATDHMILLAAFKASLHNFTGQDDMLVGTHFACRNYPGLENVYGCFVNTLMIRTSLASNPTFLDLLEQVRDTMLNAHANQDLRLDMLTTELNARQLPVPNYLTTFAFRAPLSKLRLADLHCRRIKIHRPTMPWGMQITAHRDNADQYFAGGAAFDARQHDPAGVARMLAGFESVLEQVAHNPELRLSQLQVRRRAA